MLCELSIKQFAIIDDVTIRFTKGLNMLTGETGAGKSIIINAVNLILGSRASGKLVRSGSDTAEIEAFFEINPDSQTALIMQHYGYNPTEGLLIRRVISQNERHRIYINSHMTTMQVLNQVTENLACISGQHAYQSLLKDEQHLFILDQYGGLIDLREKLIQTYRTILPQIREIAALKEKQKKKNEHLELIEFEQKEIEQANIQLHEDADLEKERYRLRHAESIVTNIHQIQQDLYHSQGAVLERIGTVIKQLEKISALDSKLLPYGETLTESIYRIEDVVSGLDQYLNQIQIDEKRLEEVENRLDFLNKLKRKYGGTLEKIVEYYDHISNELKNACDLDDRIKALETKLITLKVNLYTIAKELSIQRQKHAVDLSKAVENELKELMMPHAQFNVSLKTHKGEETESCLNIDGVSIYETGMDRAYFMISPNIGEELKPLSKIASGGELSRVVLALKVILAEKESVGTIVFDEVDSGIGGSTAEVVGKKIANLSRYHQIICITHLAQIAKFGQTHFKITKQISNGRTATLIQTLSSSMRIEEIARMLGGIHITQTTLDHAKEMLETLLD
ncbi:MAG: DNA repair protein RecN [Desulfobacterales bacterium]|nr:DNA repair protein RecN [Desulfobacterales bacterium]